MILRALASSGFPASRPASTTGRQHGDETVSASRPTIHDRRWTDHRRSHDGALAKNCWILLFPADTKRWASNSRDGRTQRSRQDGRYRTEDQHSVIRVRTDPRTSKTLLKLRAASQACPAW